MNRKLRQDFGQPKTIENQHAQHTQVGGTSSPVKKSEPGLGAKSIVHPFKAGALKA
jgi:hypothetical protein